MISLYIIIVVLAIYFLVKKFKNAEDKPLPGPTRLPLIGNAHQFNNENMHFILSDWAYKYGPIFETYIFGQRLVVLNSEYTLRKGLSSDNLRLVLAGRQDYFYAMYSLYNNESILFYQDINFGRKMRKNFTKGMHVYGDGTQAFEDIVWKEISGIADKMANYEGRDFDPNDFIRVGIGNIISVLLDGRPINDTVVADDMFWQFVRASDILLNTNRSLIATAMPFLRFVPGEIRRCYLILLRVREQIYDRYVSKMKETFVPGKVRGLVDVMLQSRHDDIEAGNEAFYTDARIANVVLETVLAGLNTSLATICSIVLCLIHDQKLQDRLYKEIIDVIGPSERPTLGVRFKMPFLEALIHESLRNATPGPLAIPHLCTEDVDFDGYKLKNGDVVILNLWHLHHNENTFEDPFEFRPDRYLDEDGQIISPSHPYRKNWMPFGLGQRQCVGENLARTRIFLVVCTLFQRYRFLPPKDGECLSSDPRTYRTGIVHHPNDFNCRVESR